MKSFEDLILLWSHKPTAKHQKEEMQKKGNAEMFECLLKLNYALQIWRKT